VVCWRVITTPSRSRDYGSTKQDSPIKTLFWKASAPKIDRVDANDGRNPSRREPLLADSRRLPEQGLEYRRRRGRPEGREQPRQACNGTPPTRINFMYQSEPSGAASRPFRPGLGRDAVETAVIPPLVEAIAASCRREQPGISCERRFQKPVRKWAGHLLEIGFNQRMSNFSYLRACPQVRIVYRRAGGLAKG